MDGITISGINTISYKRNIYERRGSKINGEEMDYSINLVGTAQKQFGNQFKSFRCTLNELLVN